jgi:crotonobetainyl-CoA:carnitine CoA-transferase CaiB-like acyl-CoA transferase
MTVRRLLEETDSGELAEWEAFDRLEPIDSAARGELANAIVAQTLANIHRDKNAEAFAASDFMMDWGRTWRDAAADPTAAAAVVQNQVNNAVKSLGLTWE